MQPYVNDIRDCVVTVADLGYGRGYSAANLG